MTNEIKEILYLEKYIDKYKSDEKNIINGNRLTTPAMLDYLEVKALLDYITNLQNEIFDLKDTLQNKNDCIGAYECIIEDRDKRIDKAIEYINKFESIKAYFEYEECGYTEYNYDEDFKQDLLDILRGDE